MPKINRAAEKFREEHTSRSFVVDLTVRRDSDPDATAQGLQAMLHGDEIDWSMVPGMFSLDEVRYDRREEWPNG